MIQAIKIKLYPTEDQKIYINKMLGTNRFIYNQCLNYKINEYKLFNSNTNLTDTYNHVKELKSEFEWIKENHSKVIQQTLINLDTAYKNFFKNGSGFPKFKKKMNPMNVRFPIDSISGLKSTKKSTIKGNRINLIKQLKDIHFKCSRQDEIDLNKYQKSIKSATLSKDKTNDYYLSILLDKPLKLFKNKGNGTVGIDLGIKDFVITSEGQTYDNLNFNKRQQNKLKRYHRNLSRKQKGSKNKEKARLKLARLNKKINNQKQYYLHSIVNQLLSENQTIVIEDLNVKSMLKNHKLAKSIQDVSWYRFKEILKYKAKWYGKKIIEINRFFPSSKLCHVCGYKNSDLTLKDRTWDCPKCGTHLDRDLNAALNIKSEGLKILNRDELDRINASGVQVTRPTKKEETNCKIICTT
jgi:putative transposase